MRRLAAKIANSLLGQRHLSKGRDRRSRSSQLTSHRSMQGQGLVEFALLLPILLWVLLGVLDFGRLYRDYVTIANASRVGAEYAMDPRRNAADVRRVIRQETSALAILDTDITLTASPSWAAGSELSVTVKYDFEAITPFVSAIWGGGPLSLSADTVTRFNSP